ncbi:MAG: endonuclease [Chloroflexota bacterium]|nr:endonuclease [Chloroflexota bacterium]
MPVSPLSAGVSPVKTSDSTAATAAVASHSAAVLDIYEVLRTAYGGEIWHWMPGVAQHPMDIIAGAVLVQHTTWTNAERALEALRDAGVLDAGVLASMPEAAIAVLVRFSGTPTVKAKRLRAICETVERAGGIDTFLAQPADSLRMQLLATHGVGPETADSIALYAGGKPVFVIDAYTRRLFGRLGLGPEDAAYDAWQRWFEESLSGAGRGAVETYRRYHGYIVLHSKALCRAVPRCARCPLLARCPEGKQRVRNTAAASQAAL